MAFRSSAVRDVALGVEVNLRSVVAAEAAVHGLPLDLPGLGGHLELHPDLSPQIRHVRQASLEEGEEGGVVEVEAGRAQLPRP